MRLTVYIPNYNHAKTLYRAINSAASQDGIDEVVVIDDCSTDGSLEICRACATLFPKFRFVRHTSKSERWEEAAARIFETFTGSHIVGLGADDFLIAGYADTIRKHPNAAAIFPSYYMVYDGTSQAFGKVEAATSVRIDTPEEATARIASPDTPPTETGIGAAISRECIEWLVRLRYWESGPWCDAIGYSAVAAKFGAVYLPDVLACFSHNPNGYGGREREGKDATRFRQAAADFVERAGIAPEAAIQLLMKRDVIAPT